MKFLDRFRKKKQLYFVPFYHEMGTIISTSPYIKWDENLFRMVFEDIEYTTNLVHGKEYIYEMPEFFADYSVLVLAKHDLRKIARVINVDKTGMTLEPTEEYEKFMSRNRDNMALKNLFVQYDSGIIYAGTWIIPKGKEFK